MRIGIEGSRLQTFDELILVFDGAVNLPFLRPAFQPRVDLRGRDAPFLGDSEQIISIRDIINELAGPDGVADYEDIVRIAQERGIPPAKVDSWLKRWAQEGEIYSPVKNKYKLVERL